MLKRLIFLSQGRMYFVSGAMQALGDITWTADFDCTATVTVGESDTQCDGLFHLNSTYVEDVIQARNGDDRAGAARRAR